jgi:DNA repair protein SbcC/Rad50
MKILGIRIKNLASLEGLTDIDFTQEPLSSAGIFAITGPTGAGKSTILDALCLALYGKTPRYLQAKESGIEITDVQGSSINQSDVRGILRDGTGEGFAEVGFVGVDGQQYRATWRVRRARDKAEGSLQAYSIGLKNINTNTDIPGRKTELQEEIERLVGLNFEQFTRSVLLAQGEFTAFLRANKDEKSALLEKLTGSHIYSEISKQIFAHYSEEKREQEDLNLRRQGIATLTAEEEEDLLRQKTTMEQGIAIQEKETEALTREIAWHSQHATLQSSLSTAQASLQQATEAKQQAIEREQLLQQVEQVQATRTWVDNQQATNDQLANKTNALQQLQQALWELQQRKEGLDIQLQKANEDVTAKSQQLETALPLLAEARALDIHITEKAEQVNKAAIELKEAQQRYQQLEQQLKDQQQEAERLQTVIEQLTQWKADNTARQPIAENQSLISSKLNDARKLLDALQLLLPKIDNTQKTIGQAHQAKTELEAQSTTIALSRQELQTKHAATSEVLVAIPIAALEKQKADIDTEIEDIIPAEAHWKILFHTQTELGNVNQALDHHKNELNTKTALLAKAADDLAIAKTERDTSLRMLDKARLAAAENVESLRSQLTAGEECPVCGSTEHPYIAQHPQLENVLQQLETAHQQHQKVYETALATESSLQQNCQQLKESIHREEQDVQEKELTLTAHRQTWEGFTIHTRAAAKPDEQRAGWLKQQLQDARAKQKDLQQQIKSYTTQKRELDGLQQKLNDIERQLNDNDNAVKDTARNLHIAEEQLTGYNKEQENRNIALAAIEQDLSDYFTVKDWFHHWQVDPASFVQHINTFADKWKTSLQQLEETTRQYEVLAATIKARTQQVQDLATEVQQKQQVFTGLKNQHDALTQKRQAIFNGEAAAVVEQDLKQVVVTTQQVLEQIKTDQNQLQTEITRTGTLQQQLEKDMAALKNQAVSFAQKIQDWITAYNSRNNFAIDSFKLLQLLMHNTEWIETERMALRTVDDTITQAQSILEERTIQLQLHEQQRISERNADMLNELLTTAKASLQQQTKEKNEIGFRLQQDLDNKQKIGDLLAIIEAKSLIVENWAKLNEIIGSADGKKFRQVAQEYTLDVLLSYANVHLEILSRRYLLQRIPNTLGLQVLDQDMGDEVRTVYSLSGGESFLVSLALALGLASLSSSRMQVESLFIDEGFGSLDPATLNIAMDSLERLHNQGRKVGVISHVQEMTERIPVQVKVSKQNSGRSKVEII